MIAIYANWTGNALVLADTLDAALSKLTELDCQPGTTIGRDPAQLTALDVGPEFRHLMHLPPLWRAVQCYPGIDSDLEVGA